MRVTLQDDRVSFEELTEEQWKAGQDWVNGEPVNYEVWEEDHSRFVLHLPTAEQLESFNSALREAG